MKELIVVGAGGHAKVVIATARASGWRIGAILDDDSRRWGERMMGVAVSGPNASGLTNKHATCVLAIGANSLRHWLAATAECKFATIVHPSAIVDISAKLGPGTVVFAGSVIQPDTRIGPHGIVNTGASVDHDCLIGEAVHIAPGARLAGNVTLGDEVLVGINAAIIPGIAVGAKATIGAGAAVVRDVPPGATVVGVPARVR